MQLWVGLGNPGPEHHQQRHNIGFMAVDAMHRRHFASSPWREKHGGLCCDAVLGGEKIILFKPLSYMNRSGDPVQRVLHFYKIASQQMVVLHDELALAPGKLRYKFAGGHAGHNGLRSIDAAVGNAYGRLRLGIGHPGDPARVSDYVLGNFSQAEHEWLDKLLDTLSCQVELLVSQQYELLQTRVAMAVGVKKPAASPPPLSRQESS